MCNMGRLIERVRNSPLVQLPAALRGSPHARSKANARINESLIKQEDHISPLP
jgi:hypothetical protein